MCLHRFTVIILAIVEVIIILLLIFLRKRLLIAIALIKEASKYVCNIDLRILSYPTFDSNIIKITIAMLK